MQSWDWEGNQTFVYFPDLHCQLFVLGQCLLTHSCWGERWEEDCTWWQSSKAEDCELSSDWYRVCSPALSEEILNFSLWKYNLCINGNSQLTFVIAHKLACIQCLLHFCHQCFQWFSLPNTKVAIRAPLCFLHVLFLSITGVFCIVTYMGSFPQDGENEQNLS